MNSKSAKQNFAEIVLKLNEHVQNTLMEIVQKYINKEEPATPIASVENDVVESLMVQLKQKDVERNNLLEHVKKMEQENEELAQKLIAIERDRKSVV